MKIRHKLFDKVTVCIAEGEFKIDGVTVVDDSIGQILLTKNKNLEQIVEETVEKKEVIEADPITPVENKSTNKKGQDKK